jgi:very-short-patch-repair endonuclease
MTVHQARRLRRTMTAPELTLWNYLQTRPDGLKFRRQRALGPYIFDFFCVPSGVAIEVDGMAHEMGRNPERDAARDQWAEARGIKVMRFRAVDVQKNLEGVCAAILAGCRRRTPPPPAAVPLPAKSRGGK